MVAGVVQARGPDKGTRTRSDKWARRGPVVEQKGPRKGSAQGGQGVVHGAEKGPEGAQKGDDMGPKNHAQVGLQSNTPKVTPKEKERKQVACEHDKR